MPRSGGNSPLFCGRTAIRPAWPAGCSHWRKGPSRQRAGRRWIGGRILAPSAREPRKLVQFFWAHFAEFFF